MHKPTREPANPASSAPRRIVFSVLGVDDDRYRGAPGRRTGIKKGTDLMRVYHVRRQLFDCRSQVFDRTESDARSFMHTSNACPELLGEGRQCAPLFHANDRSLLSQSATLPDEVQDHVLESSAIEGQHNMSHGKVATDHDSWTAFSLS